MGKRNAVECRQNGNFALHSIISTMIMTILFVGAGSLFYSMYQMKEQDQEELHLIHAINGAVYSEQNTQGLENYNGPCDYTLPIPGSNLAVTGTCSRDTITMTFSELNGSDCFRFANTMIYNQKILSDNRTVTVNGQIAINSDEVAQRCTGTDDVVIFTDNDVQLL